MYIEYEDLHKFKRMNLADIFKSYNYTPKRRQNGFIANCPFHDDKEYSLSINRKNEVWLWHCRVCRIGGSVIDFIMRKESLTLKEAYAHLKEKLRLPNSGSSYKIQDNKLIKYVLEYYEDVFKNTKSAQEYMLKLGLSNPVIFQNFKIGLSDGTLPHQKAFVPNLKEIGILDKKEEEVLKDFIVFGTEDIDKNILGLSGLSKDKRVYLGRGIFNARSFRGSKRIYLTRDVIEALSLYQVGIYDAIPLRGDYAVTCEYLKYMKEYLTKEVVLCLGDGAAGEISQKLKKDLGIICYRLNLPEGVKSLNEWLLKGMKKSDILKSVTPLKDAPRTVIKDSSPQTPSCAIRNENEEFYFDFNEKDKMRTYRVRGLDLNQIATLRGNLKLTTKAGSHLDTFDLTSSTSRERFKRMAHKLLNIDESLIHQDLSIIIDNLENIQSKYLEEKRTSPKKTPKEMTEEERVEAFNLLKDPRLLDRIVGSFHKSGYVGEDMNLLMGYLVATSRHLENPLSLLLISRSSAGKTSLQDAILSFMPEEDVIKYTRLTNQSLFYHEEDALYKKVLAIEEEQGALGAGYAIRNVLTSKALKTGSTIKDPETGRLKNQNTRVKVQTSVFLTTTRQTLDPETINRFIIATIDESEIQTSRVLRYQRRLYGKEGFELRKERARLQRLHKNAQRLIEPLDIVNPYEDALTFTTKTLRARREQIKYLTLINTVALLRQHQKEIKRRKDKSEYIEVDPFDIEVANKLSRAYLTKNLEHVSPPARNLYKELQRMILSIAAKKERPSEEIFVSRRDIVQYTAWSEWQVRTHINELVELEYVIPVQGKQGKRYCYRLAEDTAFELPTVDIGLSMPGDTKNTSLEHLLTGVLEVRA